ncbi:ANTAR domain-containing protein [Mycolicibacterium pallens]|uniref:ANTAR domain-containing protein n=1 Tax=Mycolicibacterium pallens TaxID=370524 RepID=A0ABX8VQW4_9MYCO|nr:ANTAR domain-containing protein [Mycolicibacterium pallens]QYL20229.1 ANTAR domain-containing protein [Mycolicibacterium pallens]
MSTAGYDHPDPRRSADRMLDTAEGVLVALRRYRLNDAFRDLMTTARRHNVNPLTLADALVALAENHGVNALDTDVVAIARHTWGPLLDQPRNHQTPHDDDHP